MNWISERWHDFLALDSQSWLTIAAWAAVIVGISALFYARAHNQTNRRLAADQARPNVAMLLEPSAHDWNVVELVIRNFGKTAAFDVHVDFVNAPTVARYEDEYDGSVPPIEEVRIPDLGALAPGQEWRTIWDSASDRKTLGTSIESRFEGTLTYADRPEGREFQSWRRRQRYEYQVILDWGLLPPAERLDLMTTHDSARREKQKLELLRGVLDYYHAAAHENDPQTLSTEIDRVTVITNEVRDRLRTALVPATD